MKMITAIINGKDATDVSDALTREGFYFTKIATSGGFLKAKNITLLIGTEDENVSKVIDIIRKNSAQRKELMTVMGNMNIHSLTSVTTEVLVGGATVFVTDVIHYEKM